MDKYPQCRFCAYADWERLGKPKCKKDNKHITGLDTMVFAMCPFYKHKPETKKQ